MASVDAVSGADFVTFCGRAAGVLHQVQVLLPRACGQGARCAPSPCRSGIGIGEWVCGCVGEGISTSRLGSALPNAAYFFFSILNFEFLEGGGIEGIGIQYSAGFAATMSSRAPSSPAPVDEALADDPPVDDVPHSPAREDDRDSAYEAVGSPNFGS